MLSFVAALALTQLHADRVTIHARVLSLDPSQLVEIEGSKIEKKRYGTYIVGTELAVKDEVEAVIGKHAASEQSSQDIPALIGQRVSRSFTKGGQTQTLEFLAEGASTTGSLGSSYGVDVAWKFGTDDRIYSTEGISHHFDLHKGEGGLVLLQMKDQRWMMLLTISKA